MHDDRPAALSSVPIVSVIVPVLNDPRRIGRCIEALLKQTYPRDRLQLIIVDNGSQDETRDVIGRYPVTLLVEDGRKTPYVARNTGIKHSRGTVIALTDADCVPIPEWIDRGVRRLTNCGADLVGGKVVFSFSSRRRSAETYDSITNLEMERNIRDRGVAKTGNLFFRRQVADDIGLFPEQQRSGGDIVWTGRATSMGFRMVYSPEAVVTKPARSLKSLLRKQYRVGKAQTGIWREAGCSHTEVARKILWGLRPPSRDSIRRRIRRRGIPEMESEILSLSCVGWMCCLSMSLGRIRSLLGR